MVQPSVRTTMVTSIKPIPEIYDAFTELVKSITRKNIPKDCRTWYTSGLTPEITDKLNRCTEMYEAYPFDEDTVEEGENLLRLFTDEKRKKCCDLLVDVNMKRSSKKAWDLIKQLNNDPIQKLTI